MNIGSIVRISNHIYYLTFTENVTKITSSPTNQQLIHFQTIAYWVRVLHVYERDQCFEYLPWALCSHIMELLNNVHPFLNLHSVVLRHNGTVKLCLQSYVWAEFLIQDSLRSLDLSTTHEYGGFLLTHSHIIALCTAIRRKAIPLIHLAVRCVHPEETELTWSAVPLAISSIRSLSSLKRLSINGSLLCGSALLEIGSLCSLEILEIEGGIPAGMRLEMPGEGEFPVLKTLALRFFPPEDSRTICNSDALLSSLQVIAVEWDSQTEFGNQDIDRTLDAIGTRCSSLLELRVGLFEMFRPRKAHGVAYPLWRNLASHRLRVVAFLGMFLRADRLRELLQDLKDTWPNLDALVVPAHTLKAHQKKMCRSGFFPSTIFVHSGNVNSQHDTMFTVW
jgi:hypothetical protein